MNQINDKKMVNELVFPGKSGRDKTTSLKVVEVFSKNRIVEPWDLFEGTLRDDVKEIFSKQRQPAPEQKTYLITDGKAYKIGRAKDPNKRLHQLKIANPRLVLVCVIDRDVERHLHNMFRDKSLLREWFSLSGNDVNYIKSL